MHSQETDNSTIVAEKQIVADCLGLPSSEELEFVDSGWDSRIYCANDRAQVFKFPRSAKVQGRYPAEIEALRLIGDTQDDVLIPKVRWVGDDYSYFGYDGIQGQTLQARLPELGESEKRRIGALLGKFLRQLHVLSLENVRDMRPDREVGQLQEWYGRCRGINQQYFTDAERQRLDELVYDVWPRQIESHDSRIVLCHDDFHSGNILLTDDSRVGVIDFGDVCMADHSRDLTHFADKTMFDSALAAYASDDPVLLDKIRLRQNMRKVIVLTAEITKNQPGLARDTANAIKSYLS